MTKETKKEIAKKILEKYVEWDIRDFWSTKTTPFVTGQTLEEMLLTGKIRLERYLERDDEPVGGLR